MVGLNAIDTYCIRLLYSQKLRVKLKLYGGIGFSACLCLHAHHVYENITADSKYHIRLLLPTSSMFIGRAPPFVKITRNCAKYHESSSGPGRAVFGTIVA